MGAAEISTGLSLCTGLLSAVFWVAAAFVKAPVHPELAGKPDGAYWTGLVVNGGDLLGTARKQAKWNSAAALAAAATVLFQIGANFL